MDSNTQLKKCHENAIYNWNFYCVEIDFQLQIEVPKKGKIQKSLQINLF